MAGQDVAEPTGIVLAVIVKDALSPVEIVSGASAFPLGPGLARVAVLASRDPDRS